MVGEMFPSLLGATRCVSKEAKGSKRDEDHRKNREEEKKRKRRDCSLFPICVMSCLVCVVSVWVDGGQTRHR